MRGVTFSYGDRVVVKSVPFKYSDYPEIRGALGTVRRVYRDNISVKLDDHNHPTNHNGYFYFGPGHLRFESISAELFRYDYDLEQYIKHDIESIRGLDDLIHDATEARIKKEENTMTYDVPMLPNFTVVGVKFPTNNGKEYAFACYEDNLNIDDLIVVRNSNGSYSLATVASIGLLDKDKVLNGCEVVDKIDLTASEARYAKAKEIADLKKEMDEKVAALQAVALYELMAEKDPALKAMLEQFKELTK